MCTAQLFNCYKRVDQFQPTEKKKTKINSDRQTIKIDAKSCSTFVTH